MPSPAMRAAESRKGAPRFWRVAVRATRAARQDQPIWLRADAAVGLLAPQSLHVGPQLGQLAAVAAREDREPAPGLGVEVLIVQMERRRVPLSLPLVATPELEEPLHPRGQLSRRVLRIP